jgi:hypothetical protein
MGRISPISPAGPRPRLALGAVFSGFFFFFLWIQRHAVLFDQSADAAAVDEKVLTLGGGRFDDCALLIQILFRHDPVKRVVLANVVHLLLIRLDVLEQSLEVGDRLGAGDGDEQEKSHRRRGRELSSIVASPMRQLGAIASMVITPS